MDSFLTGGIDTAQRLFYLHREDSRGQVVLREKLSRRRLVAYLSNLPAATPPGCSRSWTPTAMSPFLIATWVSGSRQWATWACTSSPLDALCAPHQCAARAARILHINTCRGIAQRRFEVKRFIPWLALLSYRVASSDEPAKTNTVQAVMYEFTYNAQTLAITHAQVIGGYPSVDECREAMPKVAATGSPQLHSGEQMQLQCSGIRSPDGVETPAVEPAVSTTNL